MNVCIISESAKIPAESFVEAHKNYLHGNIHFLYGGTLPKYDQNNEPIAVYPTFTEKVLKKITGDDAFCPLKDGVKQYLQKHKIQVVLAEYGTTGAQIFPLCRELKIPMIVHFHGYDISKQEVLDFHKELYKEMFAYVSYIVAVSEDMKDDLIAAGAAKGKTVVNPYGPNNAFFKIEPDYHSNNFLAVGRLIDKKAPYYTLAAFKRVHELYPELKLVMIGGGYLANACKNLIRYLGLGESVELIDTLPHADLVKYFANAFCFIQHSIVANDGDAEGTPVAILEASAAGLPIVSTKHKGIKEAVVHGKTGYLVDEHDVSNMFQYMKAFAEDRALAARLGANASEYIRENYSMQKHIDNLNALIKSLL